MHAKSPTQMYFNRLEIAAVRRAAGDDLERQRAAVQHIGAWPADAVDSLPEPTVIDERDVPSVRVYRGVQWNLPAYTYEPQTSYTIDELAQWLLPSKYESPARSALPTRTDVSDTEDVSRERDQYDLDAFRWTQRDESDELILTTWNSDPESEMTLEQKAERAAEREAWKEQQTAFLRRKLHRLLQTYFGKADYRQSSIVTKYENVNGRFIARESQPILDWVKSRVADRGTELSGFASACRSIEYRLAKRRSRKHGTAIQQLAA